jgi:hypothetical protein
MIARKRFERQRIFSRTSRHRLNCTNGAHTSLRDGIFAVCRSPDSISEQQRFSICSVGCKPKTIRTERGDNGRLKSRPSEIRFEKGDEVFHIRMTEDACCCPNVMIEATGRKLDPEIPVSVGNVFAELVGFSDDIDSDQAHLRLWKKNDSGGRGHNLTITLDFEINTVSRAVTKDMDGEAVKVDGRIGELGQIEIFVAVRSK